MNTLSTDVGYRGAAAAAAFAAILISTNWLRQLPSRALLPRIVSRALLGASVTAVLAAVASPRWEGLATIVATILATSAVLIQTDLDKAAQLLSGVAVISAGVAGIGLGITILHGGDVLGGVAYIGLGVAFIGLGIAFIGLGIAVLRGTDIVAYARNWLASLTQDPDSEALRHDDHARPGLDNPPPAITTPPPEPPHAP